MRVRLTSSQTLPFLGKATSTSSLYKLATIAETEAGFTLTEGACEFVFEGGTAPLKLSLDPETIRSGPAMTTAIKIWDDEGVVRFDRDFATVILGAQLKDADLDALPTDKNDPRVIDADQDGQAGLTAHASGTIKLGFIKKNIEADIYFVQRSRDKFTGTLVEGGRLSGSVIDETEQSFLGSNNILLTLGGNVLTVQEVDRSSVEFVRISDTATCDTVKFKTVF